MYKLIIAGSGAILSVCALAATPALALNGKSWVANNGLDMNNCATPATACRTFQHAYDQTNAGGEIGVVNAGDYGPVFINHSISITNDSGGEAGILNIDGTCGGAFPMEVNLQRGEIVSVRGLVFEGCGNARAGVSFGLFGTLHIQNCVFRDFEGAFASGLSFQPDEPARLFISDSSFFNNSTGIVISLQSPGPGSADVVMERVQLNDNVVGLRLDGTFGQAPGLHAVLRDSVVTGNAGDGLSVSTQSGSPPAFLFVEGSAIFGNTGNGIVANGAGATVLLSDSTITRNGTGVSAVNGGQIYSYRNNRNNNNIGAEGSATGFLGANF